MSIKIPYAVYNMFVNIYSTTDNHVVSFTYKPINNRRHTLQLRQKYMKMKVNTNEMILELEISVTL